YYYFLLLSTPFFKKPPIFSRRLSASGIQLAEIEDPLLCIVQPDCKIERSPVQDIRSRRLALFCLPVDQPVISFFDLRHKGLSLLIRQVRPDALRHTAILVGARDPIHKRLDRLLQRKSLPVSALLYLLLYRAILKL